MPDPRKGLETQIKNIQTKTGKTLEELAAIARKSGLKKHGQIRDMFKNELGLGHGDDPGGGRGVRISGAMRNDQCWAEKAYTKDARMCACRKSDTTLQPKSI